MHLKKFIASKLIGYKEYEAHGSGTLKHALYNNNVIVFRFIHRGLNYQYEGDENPYTQECELLTARHIVEYKRIKRQKRTPYIYAHNSSVLYPMVSLRKVNK